jgi:hypothetical protein
MCGLYTVLDASVAGVDANQVVTSGCLLGIFLFVVLVYRYPFGQHSQICYYGRRFSYKFSIYQRIVYFTAKVWFRQANTFQIKRYHIQVTLFHHCDWNHLSSNEHFSFQFAACFLGLNIFSSVCYI